jgi:phosphoribosylformylglycinamidine cyclo-ligase
MSAYKEAGVDVEKAEEIVRYLGMSGYGSVIKLGNVWIVLSTDGVGTKLLVAEEIGKFDTIGIDLVAMCANDVLCHGARPHSFLDYYATGKLDIEKTKQILTGIQTGCELAGCKLVGGETAELPGMYTGTQFDLAGFCMGIVARKDSNYLYEIPRGDIVAGDVIVGIPSSGPHSNGYSLIREIYRPYINYEEYLLTPTRIYVKEVMSVLPYIKAVAHITGGGIHGNLPRVLPTGTNYNLPITLEGWWQELYDMSKIEQYEFECVFNCGWGMLLVVSKYEVTEVLEEIKDAVVVGDIA